ncbi:MAG: hypothetical protein AAF790_01985 [Planctomycetota bacterium]
MHRCLDQTRALPRHATPERTPADRPEGPADDLRRIDFMPTPGEIAGVCAQIRSGWSSSEKRRRFNGVLPDEAAGEPAWRPPVIDTSHFHLHGLADRD